MPWYVAASPPKFDHCDPVLTDALIQEDDGVYFALKEPGSMASLAKGPNNKTLLFAKNSMGNNTTAEAFTVISTYLNQFDFTLDDLDLGDLAVTAEYITPLSSDHGCTVPIRDLTGSTGRPQQQYFVVTSMSRQGSVLSLAETIVECTRLRLPMCETWVPVDPVYDHEILAQVTDNAFRSVALYEDLDKLFEWSFHISVVDHVEAFGPVAEGVIVSIERDFDRKSVFEAMTAYRAAMTSVKCSFDPTPIIPEPSPPKLQNKDDFASMMVHDDGSKTFRMLKHLADSGRVLARRHAVLHGKTVWMLMFTSDDAAFVAELASRDEFTPFMTPGRSMMVYYDPNKDLLPSMRSPVKHKSKVKFQPYCRTTMGVRNPVARENHDILRAWNNVQKMSDYLPDPKEDKYVEQWAEYAKTTPGVTDKVAVGRYIDALKEMLEADTSVAVDRPILVLNLTDLRNPVVGPVAAVSKKKTVRRPGMVYLVNQLLKSDLADCPIVVMVVDPAEANPRRKNLAAIARELTTLLERPTPEEIEAAFPNFVAHMDTLPTPPTAKVVAVCPSTVGMGKSFLLNRIGANVVVASDEAIDYNLKFTQAISDPKVVVAADKNFPDNAGLRKFLKQAGTARVVLVVPDHLEPELYLERVKRRQEDPSKPKALVGSTPDVDRIVQSFYTSAKGFLPVVRRLEGTITTNVFNGTEDPTLVDRIHACEGVPAPVLLKQMEEVSPVQRYLGYHLGIGSLHITIIPPTESKMLPDERHQLESMSMSFDGGAVVTGALTKRVTMQDKDGNKVRFWTVDAEVPEDQQLLWKTSFSHRTPHVTDKSIQTPLKPADAADAAHAYATRDSSRYTVTETTTVCIPFVGRLVWIKTRDM